MRAPFAFVASSILAFTATAHAQLFPGDWEVHSQDDDGTGDHNLGPEPTAEGRNGDATPSVEPPPGDLSKPWRIHLPYSKPVTAIVEPRVTHDLLVTVDFFKRFQLFIGSPISLSPNSKSALGNPTTLFPRASLGDVRVGQKLRILRADEHFIDMTLITQLNTPLGLGFTAPDQKLKLNQLPQPRDVVTVTGRPFVGNTTLLNELQISRDFGPSYVTAKMGLRVRRPTELGNADLSGEITSRATTGFKGKRLQNKVKFFQYVPLEFKFEAAQNMPITRPPAFDPARVDQSPPIPFSSGELVATTGLEYQLFHPYVSSTMSMSPGNGNPTFKMMLGLKMTTEFLGHIPTGPQNVVSNIKSLCQRVASLSDDHRCVARKAPDSPARPETTDDGPL